MNIKEKIKSYIRVLMLTKKPDKDEVTVTLRIVLIGMGLIGLIGFIFYLISVLLLGRL